MYLFDPNPNFLGLGICTTYEFMDCIRRSLSIPDAICEIPSYPDGPRRINLLYHELSLSCNAIDTRTRPLRVSREMRGMPLIGF